MAEGIWYFVALPFSFRTVEVHMNKQFVSGTRPYSDAERERDRTDVQRATGLQAARREATPSGQRYDTPLSQAHRRKTDRMVGSE